MEFLSIQDLLLYPHGDIGLVFLIFKEGILLLKHLTLIEGYFSLLKLTSSPHISVIDDFFGTTNISKKIEDALIRQGANFLKSYVNSHKTQSTQLVCISQREKTAYSLFRNDLSWNGGGYRVKETFLRYYRNIVFSIKIKGDKTTPGADLGDNDFVGKPEIVSCEAIVYTKDGDGWIGAKIEKK